MPTTRKTAAAKAAATRRRRDEANTKGPNSAKANAPKFYELDFDGEHYVIESENANDLELYEAIENERYLHAISGFLGAEQWVRFKESQRNDAGRVPMDRFEDFLNACMEAIGAGNGSSSPGSSGSTARR